MVWVGDKGRERKLYWDSCTFLAENPKALPLNGS